MLLAAVVEGKGGLARGYLEMVFLGELIECHAHLYARGRGLCDGCTQVVVGLYGAYELAYGEVIHQYAGRVEAQGDARCRAKAVVGREFHGAIVVAGERANGVGNVGLMLLFWVRVVVQARCSGASHDASEDEGKQFEASFHCMVSLSCNGYVSWANGRVLNNVRLATQQVHEF